MFFTATKANNSQSLHLLCHNTDVYLTHTQRDYIDLIDVTELPDDSDSGSEVDELPPVPIAFSAKSGESSRY